ncbi:uncharacterized protein LOC111073515 [Drosophila obscura]|uniref:uncharacterized protein LOC111073515 n=1 Tax=Drosophila obscura TaxID=7282 RepID=UPI001BB198D2|nr:uncharacterized protein LOC111073515 [Drosophila obscura]
MSQVSILILPIECFYEIFKYIKKNCERDRPDATDDIKYDDLISFTACCEPILHMLSEWDLHLFNKISKFVSLKISIIHIDFEKLYNRLKAKSAKDKETYWAFLSHAIRRSTGILLLYAPESFHRDHLETFQTVIGQLQNKPNLKRLCIDVRGYTLEGLGRLKSLEKLYLDIRMDIDDLIEICRMNKNLRILSFMNNETGGKRLAAIAEHCEQLEELAFKMRPDCDASEYRPLAKIPRLEIMEISGVHEKGTLQPLLQGLAANQSKVLSGLSIYEAPLDHNETQAMAQIDTLTQVECGFDDPQSIGQLCQLPHLSHLKILSKHDSRAISEQVLSLLVKSKGKMRIELNNSSITYGPSGELTLDMREENANANANACDFSPLLTLTGFTLLKIYRSPQVVSLKPVLNGFRNAPTLTDLSLGNITAEESAAVSEIVSLKRLNCGFFETQNAELLAQLPVLEALTITAVPSCPGSLRCLLSALASRESQTLHKLCLKKVITSVEAKELARLSSLRTLECQLADPLDIQLLSQLTKLEKLYLYASEMLDKILPGVLTVTKSCKKLAEIHIECKPDHSGHVDEKSSKIVIEMLQGCQDTIDIYIENERISFNRESNKLHVEMDFFKRNNLAIESLARLESVSHMEIKGYHAAGSLREFFAALALRTKHDLQSLCIRDSSLDLSETTELAKITSWKCFTGCLSDRQSFQHLLHLSDFNVFEERTGSRKITFDKFTGKLSVSPFNVRLGNGLPNGMGLSPLASLQNLRQVIISGVFEDGAMLNFFGQLATYQGQTLQELRLDNPYEMCNEELREVSRMKSLRSLACGLSPQVQDMEIEQLAQLPQLAVLVVGSHRVGSLKNLLGMLAARECPTLEHLAVRGESLTPLEVKEVCAISSLKRLECAFCSTEGVDVLSQRNCIEHLGIRTGKGEASLVDLLTAFASSGESNIQKLTIDGPAVDQESATALSLVLRIPKLKSLKLPIKDTQGIEGLAESLHLEELTISSSPEEGSLERLFRALSLKHSTKLKNLVVENTSIGLEEALQLVQVDSITSLKCAFKDEEIYSLLPKMTNLESLEITSQHTFLNISGHLLDIFRECRKLKHINLGNEYCYSFPGFVKSSLDILKSVRDPSTQGPLEMQINHSPNGLVDEMTANDKKYLIFIH